MILALIIVPATFCLWIISEKKNVVNFERNPLLKLFVKIGDWSYSLFLIHMVFIYIFKNIFSDSFLFLALSLCFFIQESSVPKINLVLGNW
ncbi:hypothetical protein EOM09_04100 [bacterium]|nr:hypothetical protein [bacterium]